MHTTCDLFAQASERPEHLLRLTCHLHAVFEVTLHESPALSTPSSAATDLPPPAASSGACSPSAAAAGVNPAPHTTDTAANTTAAAGATAQSMAFQSRTGATAGAAAVAAATAETRAESAADTTGGTAAASMTASDAALDCAASSTVSSSFDAASPAAAAAAPTAAASPTAAAPSEAGPFNNAEEVPALAWVVWVDVSLTPRLWTTTTEWKGSQASTAVLNALQGTHTRVTHAMTHLMTHAEAEAARAVLMLDCPVDAMQQNQHFRWGFGCHGSKLLVCSIVHDEPCCCSRYWA